MALIVPNATDAGTALRYTNINQSEPDSLDIEVLSNTGNYVRFGGVATQSSGNISISAGVAVIGGVPYAFSSYSFSNSAPVNNQFTVAIVRLSGTTASVTTLSGTDSATNPVFPKSKSTATAAELSANTGNLFDPATDVLLCSVWRASPSSTTDGHLVDKRVVKTGPITWAQTTVPTVDSVSSNGDMVVVSTASGTTNALYVRVSGSWLQVTNQGTVDDIVPIGGIIMWPSYSNPPSRYLECNGSTVSALTYSQLASAWGVSGTFALPDYRNKFPRGLSSGTGTGLITSTGGADSQTITTVPSHTHGLNSHTHAVNDHTHTVNAGLGNTGSDGNHSHGAAVANGAVSIVTAGDHTHTTAFDTYYNAVFQGVSFYVHYNSSSLTFPNKALNPVGNFYFTTADANDSVGLANTGYGTGAKVGGSVPTNIGTLFNLNNGSHTHTASLTSNSVTVSAPSPSTHSHTVTIDSKTGLATGGPSTANTGDASVAATTIVPTLPAYKDVRYFVRAT